MEWLDIIQNPRAYGDEHEGAAEETKLWTVQPKERFRDQKRSMSVAYEQMSKQVSNDKADPEKFMDAAMDYAEDKFSFSHCFPEQDQP